MQKLLVFSRFRCFLNRFQMAFRLHLLAGFLFCLLTVGMTWPLVTHLNTHVTSGQQPAMTVPYFNLWTLAWNNYWFSEKTENYWDANIFFPHQKALAFSEPQFATGIFTALVAFFGGNTVLAYNATLLGFLSGAAMAAYALCWWLLGTFEENSTSQRITKNASMKYRWAAAVTAGILYGFNFYMFREIGVLQLLATLFPPIAFLGIHRFFYQNRWSDAMLFSLGFLGCWYTCAYYGLFLSIFVPCFVIRLRHRGMLSKKVLVPAAATLILIFVCLLPLAYGMWSAKTTMALDRSEFVIRDLSAVFMKYFKLPQHSWLYGDILQVGAKGSLFLGGMLLCLACTGLIVIFRVRHTSDTIEQPTQPLLQRYAGFYLIMTFLAFLLSLGMSLTPGFSMKLGAYQILTWLSPYNLLYEFVPGFSSIRSPYRFSLFCALFLAILAGYGMFWVSQRFRPRWRQILVPLLIAVMIFELWPLPLRLVKVPGELDELPRIYKHVNSLPADAVLIEMPIAIGKSEQKLEADARYMYFSTFHWRQLVNGYSGFIPQAYMELVNVILGATPQVAFSALKAFGVQYVLAHTDELSEAEKTRLKQLETEHLKPIFSEGSDSLYQVDYGNKAELSPLPDIASATLYESQKSQNYVSLCFYYRLTDQQCILVTPWQNRIEFEVSWYEITDSQQRSNQPTLRSWTSYQGSKLITADSNAIEIDLSAPPPGKYTVVVQQSHASRSEVISLHCQIYSDGFVTCRGEG